MIPVILDEWQEVQRQCTAMLQQIMDVTTQLTAAQKRLTELERKKTPPAFVKANAPERTKTGRKRRATEHNQMRQRETPTDVVSHPINDPTSNNAIIL